VSAPDYERILDLERELGLPLSDTSTALDAQQTADRAETWATIFQQVYTDAVISQETGEPGTHMVRAEAGESGVLCYGLWTEGFQRLTPVTIPLDKADTSDLVDESHKWIETAIAEHRIAIRRERSKVIS
jgi:hypothetical protein